MWKQLIDFFTSGWVVFGATASVLVPLFFNWLIKVIRKWGNPPWLKEKEQGQTKRGKEK